MLKTFTVNSLKNQNSKTNYLSSLLFSKKISTTCLPAVSKALNIELGYNDIRKFIASEYAHTAKINSENFYSYSKENRSPFFSAIFYGSALTFFSLSQSHQASSESKIVCDDTHIPSTNQKPNNDEESNKHTHPLWRSQSNIRLEHKFDDALIFCGTSNQPLGESVAQRLGMKLGTVLVKRFADGEVFMQFLDSMRGKDVFIIQPTSPPVNDNLMELLLMISTCRRSSAKKITALIPYYGYARQDRKLSSRVPISAADVACMIQAMGVDRVVAIDLHCGQIQGFFGPHVPVDNLEAQIIGLDHFQTMNLEKPIVISPDAGGVYRAKKFQEGLISKGIDCGIAMLIKQRIRANEIETMELVGNVAGSDVIIVDDMIDTASTLCQAASVLRRHGAKRVYAFATHGLFSANGLQKIEASPLEQVVVTDSIKARDDVKKSSKITVLSVSVLVADAIRRIHQKESLTELFNMYTAQKSNLSKAKNNTESN